MSGYNSNAKEHKQKMAEMRNESWAKLTTTAKIEDLDARLGVGLGAVKQRKRLAAQLAIESSAPEKKVKKENVSKVDKKR